MYSLSPEELGFGGHDVSSSSANIGNYIGILSIVSKYDLCLETYLANSSMFQDTSNRVQNYLSHGAGNLLNAKFRLKRNSGNHAPLQVKTSSSLHVRLHINDT
ncbi:hypothetical protein HUJ04_000518, partial [Dendroctonus ponderosae]